MKYSSKWNGRTKDKEVEAFNHKNSARGKYFLSGFYGFGTPQEDGIAWHFRSKPKPQDKHPDTLRGSRHLPASLKTPLPAPQRAVSLKNDANLVNFLKTGVFLIWFVANWYWGTHLGMPVGMKGVGTFPHSHPWQSMGAEGGVFPAAAVDMKGTGTGNLPGRATGSSKGLSARWAPELPVPSAPQPCQLPLPPQPWLASWELPNPWPAASRANRAHLNPGKSQKCKSTHFPEQPIKQGPPSPARPGPKWTC